jgi:glycine/D-amino acid oxidase-like deaminating enzyme
VPWYLFTTKEESSRIDQVKKELKAAGESGLPANDIVPILFPFITTSMMHVRDQAQFNPLKYVQQFASAIEGENCSIFENTKAIKIDDGGNECFVEISRGKVRAKKVVQATHSPKGIYAVHTAMEVYREHAFAVKLRRDLPHAGVYWHLEENELYSMRPYSNKNGNYLIVLNASHKTGHEEHTENSFRKVEEYMRAHFDVDKIEYTWAAQNYKPADAIPYIGKSIFDKNIYIATGFGADGLTYGTLASMIISDAINGKENKWAKTYDPKRFTPAASFTRFVKENVDVATHLVKDYLLKGDPK